LLSVLPIAAVEIVNIILTGNVFLKAVSPTFAELLSPAIRIDISGSGFVDSSMFGFLKGLEQHAGRLLDLALAGITQAEEQWQALFAKIHEMTLPTLTALTCDRNPIISPVRQLFARGPKLAALSISDCLTADAVDAILVPFADLTPQFHITSLIRQSTIPSTKGGQAVVDMVLGLFQGELRAVDLTDQEIGFDGVGRIVRNMPQDMERFVFDGAKLGNVEKVIQALRKVLASPARIIAWPAADVREAAADAASEFQGQLKMLGWEFAKRQEKRWMQNSGTADEAVGQSGRIHAFEGLVCESSI
jgi:hypothetical protein